MGAENSVNQMIFFIASVLVSVAMAAVLINTTSGLATQVRGVGDSLTQEAESSIKIINDPSSMPYEDGLLIVYVKNTGTATLPINGTTVVIDGLVILNVENIAIESNASTWNPGKVLQLTCPVTLDVGDHTIKVALTAHTKDSMAFRQT
jgi:archaellum component FlaG (FlaF/FlaG flagellin family)